MSALADTIEDYFHRVAREIAAARAEHAETHPVLRPPNEVATPTLSLFADGTPVATLCLDHHGVPELRGAAQLAAQHADPMQWRDSTALDVRCSACPTLEVRDS